MDYDSVNAGVVEIPDLDAVCRDLALEHDEFVADPLAYIVRHGKFVGPWSMTLQLG